MDLVRRRVVLRDYETHCDNRADVVDPVGPVPSTRSAREQSSRRVAGVTGPVSVQTIRCGVWPAAASAQRATSSMTLAVVAP